MLKAQDISVGDHDVVAPGTASSVADGATIAVKYGRPLDVKVDGKSNRYWVTATDVSAALDQIGLRFGDADMSASRGTEISRSGMDLAVVTPKTLTVKLGGEKARKKTVTAPHRRRRAHRARPEGRRQRPGQARPRRASSTTATRSR